MVSTQYRCKNERRRIEVRKRRDENGLPILNGIDYLEVSPDQKTLFIQFIHLLEKDQLTLDNLQIQRLEGTTPIEVAIASLSISGKRLTVGVEPPTDVLPYTLRLINPLDQAQNRPPDGFDAQLSMVEFLFRVADLSEFDCKTPEEPTPLPLPPPAIDYLAKDYRSFRQLMLDRLAVTLPNWQERSAADIGIMLVELVAYRADYLSYFQDAIATEAYLGTARRRMSVRRHARLLNYPMHDGCNARAWVALRVYQPVTLPPPTPTRIQFLTRVVGLPSILSEKDLNEAINRGTQIFEPLEGATLHPALNQMSLYTWSDLSCSLPMGTTTATLEDRQAVLRSLLHPGTVLLFEEVKGSRNGEPADADPSRRHFVRLTKVEADHDPLHDCRLVRIEWSVEDALPFVMTVSQTVNDRPVSDVTIVRGNIILVDHGYTIDDPEKQTLEWRNINRTRARLPEGPLTQQGPFDPTAPASSALKWDLRNVLPAIYLQEWDLSTGKENTWFPQKDLLNSNRNAREFVVEPEDDGRDYLRFGDGQLGRQPQADAILTAVYRTGNGAAGNVGAEAIAHVYSKHLDLRNLLQPKTDSEFTDAIRNPLPATGGVAPESIEQVRLYAPQAFRKLQRAVTEADYAEIVQRFPGVSRAVASRRWTGSWYTIFITVDRTGGLPVDHRFQRELSSFLEQYRLTGQDIEIEGVRSVPLDIALQVQVLSGYYQSQVKAALLRAFSNRVLDTGQRGFFHPDNFTFGQPVYLSQVIQQAMQVIGVQAVSITRFQRWGQPSQDERERGRISFGRLEVAQLENDSNRPGRGRLELVMEGGL